MINLALALSLILVILVFICESYQIAISNANICIINLSLLILESGKLLKEEYNDLYLKVQEALNNQTSLKEKRRLIKSLSDKCLNLGIERR